MECPESIEELENMEKMLPLCKITLYEQAKARIEKGAAKSVSEAARQIAEETGKSADGIKRRIFEEQTVRGAQLSEIAGTSKHRPLNLTEADERVILRTGKQIKRARREQRQKTREQQRQETISQDPVLKKEFYELVYGDFRTSSNIPAQSIDAIITDPPYGIEFLPLYADLSFYAEKVLKPNAPCIVMTGQSWLETVLRSLSEHLTYVWTLAYFSPGKSTQIFGRKIKSNWKPVIFLVNGENQCEHIGDYINSGHYDKSHHDWGQTEEGMSQLIERFTVKNDIVLDPFCGAGTTGIACLQSGRRFVGIDTDEYAIKKSAQRLENAAGRNLQHQG